MNERSVGHEERRNRFAPLSFARRISIVNRISNILVEGQAYVRRYLAYGAVKQWVANLTIEEHQALRTYSYMGMRINRLLAEQANSGGPISNLYLRPNIPLEVVLEHLDSAIRKSRTRTRVTVYRGLPGNIVNLYDKSTVGETIEIPTFLSACENENTAIGYARPLPQHSHSSPLELRVYMQITIPKNSCAAPLGAGPFQVWSNVNEVVLPRNSKFSVLASTEETSGLKRIKMELV